MSSDEVEYPIADIPDIEEEPPVKEKHKFKKVVETEDYSFEECVESGDKELEKDFE